MDNHDDDDFQIVNSLETTLRTLLKWFELARANPESLAGC
jgi:hypothetical protein